MACRDPAMTLLVEGFISRMDCRIAACTEDVAGFGVKSDVIYLGSTAMGSVTAECVITDAFAIGSVLSKLVEQSEESWSE